MKLPEAGFSDGARLDFDFAVVDWWEWFEDRSGERVVGRDDSPKLKKGQAMVPKYPTVDDILDLYRDDETEGFGRDPVATGIDLRLLADAIDSEDDALF
ncbi:MAG: hypothetical protein AVDCRST_MAG43-263 [uncultured Thermomicrobiales bacterium]|uniref:Uncharacterized protein n=1 Tax=uncultured Thermomicrobiales bacterium TaxID=1645740 RepID=A0A6J4U7B1_9BACT|nr:MAG: hypothetical protein AVDCRST_MAG43-263 [uncultured Thermomicrobiales bacterium]